jgi:hypothetical protein
MRHRWTQTRNEADHGSKTPCHPHLLNPFPRSLAFLTAKPRECEPDKAARLPAWAGSLALLVKEDFVLMTARPEAPPARNVKRTAAAACGSV